MSKNEMEKDDLLEKIAGLREKYLDSDSVQWIDQAESDLRKLFEEKTLAEHPVFKAIVADAEKKLNEINALLMNDETGVDDAAYRKALFRERNVWRFIFDRFGFKPHDNAIQSLNEVLDNKLTQ